MDDFPYSVYFSRISDRQRMITKYRPSNIEEPIRVEVDNRYVGQKEKDSYVSCESLSPSAWRMLRIMAKNPNPPQPRRTIDRCFGPGWGVTFHDVTFHDES